MKCKAVIFDFNGTLFWDSEINYQAWNNCIGRWKGETYSRDVFHHLNGRTSKETLEYIFSDQLSGQLIKKYSEEKNKEYFMLIEKFQNGLSLAPGAEEFLNELSARKIKIGIATSALSEDMEIYETYFHLSRFFRKEYIISSDGNIRSKPDPSIYRRACTVMSMDPLDCIVFEDAKSGILSAYNAGIRQITAVDSNGFDGGAIKKMKEVSAVITHYEQFDRRQLQL